jgi:hypothetical protein
MTYVRILKDNDKIEPVSDLADQRQDYDDRDWTEHTNSRGL